MSSQFEIAVPDESDTIALAQRLAPLLRASDLLILSGGLGAGKTFFTRALAYCLGLPEDERVTSPTFTLVNEYPTHPPLMHADLYRLGDPDEVFELGLDSKREEGHLLVIEWGAPFESDLGGGAIFLDLSAETRTAVLRGTSPRALEVVRAMRGAHV